MNYPKILFTITQLFIIIFFGPHTQVCADEIYLKNGDHLSGTLVSLSPTSCDFATSYQATLHINRQELLRLLITHPVTVVLSSGDTMVGTLATDENGTEVLHSPRFGRVAVKLAEVIEIIVGREAGISLYQGRGLEDTSQPAATTTPPPETLGQTKEEQEQEERRKFFLRQAAVVLLKPGEKELEVALNYARDATTELRTRELSLPVTLRLGFTDRLEGSLSVPVVWADNESLPPQPVTNHHAVGLGDLSAHLNYLLIPEDEHWPDVMTNLSVLAPAGSSPDPNHPNLAATSSGYWRLAGSVLLVKTYDPAILFGGLAYYYTLPNTLHGVRLTPGESLTYRFGMGFAINNSLMWNSQFIGIYQAEAKREDRKISGSAREPMLLETGLSLSLTKNSYLEPSLTFGLNDEAVDATLELSYIRKF